MRIRRHTTDNGRRPTATRRTLVIGLIGVGGTMVGLSAAFACTVGLHGGLLIVPQEEPTVSNDPVSIQVYSTDQGAPVSGTQVSSSGLYIDPDPVTGPGGTNPEECLDGDDDSSDDKQIGTVTYGSPPVDPDEDLGEFLYGEGTGSINLSDLVEDTGDPLSYGTYEICTGLEPNNHWDHFRIIDDS